MSVVLIDVDMMVVLVMKRVSNSVEVLYPPYYAMYV